MTVDDMYNAAHLFVAAVRVLTHQKNMPPSVENVCELLAFSRESGHLLCRKLSDLGAIECVEGAFGDRLFVRDHARLEAVERNDAPKKLDLALKQFQNNRKPMDEEVASFKAKQKEKQKNLFEELEKKLKKDLEP